MPSSAPPSLRDRVIGLALLVLLGCFLWRDWGLSREVLQAQPLGIDFAPLWAGGRTALTAPGRLYDFAYVTGLQGWPLGEGSPRPFVYPPSALVVFAPLALIPYWTSFWVWMGATGLAFLGVSFRAGAPWWLVLLPWVVFCALCGQATFLLGALILAGLICWEREIVAGVLFGIVAALKPQLVLLLPIALLAAGRWRSLLTTGVTGLALCLASLAVWGPGLWRDWIAALPRFQQVVFANPGLVRNAVTPFAALVQQGYPGAWALVFAPLAAVWVWGAFRNPGQIADRLIALVGAALLVSPYAMNYEMALLAPAAALYMARTADPRWVLYATAACAQSFSFGVGLLTLAPALALPALRRLPASFFKS